MSKKKEAADKVLNQLWQADEVRRSGHPEAARVIENAAAADAKDFDKLPDDA